MALRIGPFVLLRSSLADDDYQALALEAMGALLTVPDLLSAHGIRRGQLAPGDAQTQERRLVLEHINVTRATARRLTSVRPARRFADLHNALLRALASYTRTLGLYTEAGLAIELADAERYRSANVRGREQDAAACEDMKALLDVADDSALDVEAPPAVQRTVSRMDAYRRVLGGAIAFWE